MDMTLDGFLQLLSDTLGLEKRIMLTTKRSDVSEWDSMGQISILSMLEENFGVTLEMEELVALRSIQDIVNILKLRDINLD